MAYYNLTPYRLRFSTFDLFEALRGRRGCFFLDSSLQTRHSGRYSFLGFDPFYILKAGRKNFFESLRERLSGYKITPGKGLPPFLGGAVGCLSYDLGRQDKANSDFPDYYFAFYNTALIVDHTARLFYVLTAGFPEKGSHLGRALCRHNLKKTESLLKCIGSRGKDRITKYAEGAPGYLKSNFTRSGYLAAIRKAKDYIKKGDIYQVNLSQRFQVETQESAFEIYRRLRRLSPAPFGAYLDAGSFQVISSSPERFLSLEGRRATAVPMKGTRPRGKNKTEDARLRRRLLDSAKDRAELTMIVDLERNDLGQVCSYDSIKVKALRALEKYQTVYQTTATIEGVLHEGKDRIDLLRACFPGGSITGCPKLRSMEIIDELEPDRRWFYTGSLGYLSFSGQMDFNILIRTILKKQDRLYFSAGGGIVADSDPEAEYEETLVKAGAMIAAVR